MSPALPKIGLAGCLTLLCCPAWSHPSEGEVAPLTVRILEHIESSRSTQTVEFLRAAQQLIVRGDLAYLARDYRRALTHYNAAFGNAPSVHTAILLNDVQWRLQLRGRSQPSSPCPAEPSGFRNTLRKDLAQGYDLGIAMAARTASDAPGEARLLKRAAEISACAHRLLDNAVLPPPGRCDDLDALRTCLGKPLLD